MIILQVLSNRIPRKTVTEPIQQVTIKRTKGKTTTLGVDIAYAADGYDELMKPVSQLIQDKWRPPTAIQSRYYLIANL